MTAEISEAIPLRRTPTDLHSLLLSTMEVLGRQAREIDVDLRIEAAGDVPRDALIDGEKIAWAVTTLVGNGLRYVRHGTRRMPGGSIVVRLRLDATGDALLVSVEDDGPGIAPEKLPLLFERERGRAHSAGLALLLIRDVVEAHGGTIDVKSSAASADHGTAIVIRLPLS
jgi:signal transduction histidine kinase